MLKWKTDKLAEVFMTYDESEENISLALTELDTVRNILNRQHKATMQIYDKFNQACEYFRCRGEIDSMPTTIDEVEGYYDSSNSVMTKYFMSKDDKSCYNNLFNLVNFFLNHQGTSAQFAGALSLLFANDKNIRVFPVRIKIKLKNEEQTADSFCFVNFVQIIDDDGTLIHSYYIDIFNNIPATIEHTKLLSRLAEKLTNEHQECIYADVDGINFYNPDIDVEKNFTIFECLTDAGGVDFNFEGYNFDYTNAAVENCINPENYTSKKEYREHLKNYLK
jgi:hypothetical protein